MVGRRTVKVQTHKSRLLVYKFTIVTNHCEIFDTYYFGNPADAFIRNANLSTLKYYNF